MAAALGAEDFLSWCDVNKMKALLLTQQLLGGLVFMINMLLTMQTSGIILQMRRRYVYIHSKYAVLESGTVCLTATQA